MSTKKSPLTHVKDQFETKEQLVDALLGLPAEILDQHDEEKDEFRKRLLSAANSKLLRMHRLGSTIKDRWGTRQALVDALLTLMNRSKDQDYRTKLGQLPISKLFDQFTAQERLVQRQKRAQTQTQAKTRAARA